MTPTKVVDRALTRRVVGRCGPIPLSREPPPVRHRHRGRSATSCRSSQGRVGIYLCGAHRPGRPHIGHIRSGVAFDVLRRWLTYRGLRRHVHPQRHRHRRQDHPQAGRRGRRVVGARNERAFGDLGLRRARLPAADRRAARHRPRARDDRADAAADRRAATPTSPRTAGDVYFDVSSWPPYGELSGQQPRTWSRPPTRTRRGKRDPRDFALWKGAKPEEPSCGHPVGPGPARAGTSSAPRWRSATSAPEFDIHGGGIDLASPTTRTRSPSRKRPATASRATGCTTPGSPQPARR